MTCEFSPNEGFIFTQYLLSKQCFALQINALLVVAALKSTVLIQGPENSCGGPTSDDIRPVPPLPRSTSFTSTKATDPRQRLGDIKFWGSWGFICHVFRRRHIALELISVKPKNINFRVNACKLQGGCLQPCEAHVASLLSNNIVI